MKRYKTFIIVTLERFSLKIFPLSKIGCPPLSDLSGHCSCNDKLSGTTELFRLIHFCMRRFFNYLSSRAQFCHPEQRRGISTSLKSSRANNSLRHGGAVPPPSGMEEHRMVNLKRGISTSLKSSRATPRDLNLI